MNAVPADQFLRELEERRAEASPLGVRFFARDGQGSRRGPYTPASWDGPWGGDGVQRMPRGWTPEEDIELGELVTVVSQWDEVARRMGRSYESVYARARRLGLVPGRGGA